MLKHLNLKDSKKVLWTSKSYIEETLQKKAIDMLVENAVFVDAPETIETIEATVSPEAVDVIESQETEITRRQIINF